MGSLSSITAKQDLTYYLSRTVVVRSVRTIDPYIDNVVALMVQLIN